MIETIPVRNLALGENLPPSELMTLLAWAAAPFEAVALSRKGSLLCRAVNVRGHGPTASMY